MKRTSYLYLVCVLTQKYPFYHDKTYEESELDNHFPLRDSFSDPSSLPMIKSFPPSIEWIMSELSLNYALGYHFFIRHPVPFVDDNSFLYFFMLCPLVIRSPFVNGYAFNSLTAIRYWHRQSCKCKWSHPEQSIPLPWGNSAAGYFLNTLFSDVDLFHPTASFSTASKLLSKNIGCLKSYF